MKRRLGILSLVIAFSLILTTWHVLAVDQIKSFDAFVGDSDSSLVGPVTADRTFSIYIGDNLSGVTNAVKSAYFAVSGVYTGGGTSTSVGPNSPTTAVNDTSVGTIAWTNSGNATLSDNAYATATAVSGVSQYLKVTGFGFGIPADSTINGIFVEIERKGSGGGPCCPGVSSDNEVRIVKSNTIDTTVNRAVAGAWSPLESFKSYGSSTDLWGLTWTAADINSANFGMALSVNLSIGDSPAFAYVDFVRITVYYTTGILKLSIDSDAATLQNFTMETVANPKPFEILYRDTTNKINPSSAGTYTYTLNIIVPSGVTVWGLGAVVTTTYRYVPASCDDGQPANEKIKTTHHFVGDSDVSITTQVNRTFSIYIGDNLSGVTDPVKSVHFRISGNYTATSNLQLGFQIDSDAATLQNFTMETVANPKPFEILYRDTTNKINPSSAGTYTYTLNIIVPSGVTIWGLGAVVTTTYRYKPPTCGTGNATGDLTSVVFDTTGVADGPAYNSILWKGTIGTGKVRLKLATSDSSTGPWDYRGPDATCSTATTSDSDWYVPAANTALEIGCVANHNNKRYFRYKAQLCMNPDCTTTGGTSPEVQDVVVSWSP